MTFKIAQKLDLANKESRNKPCMHAFELAFSNGWLVTWSFANGNYVQNHQSRTLVNWQMKTTFFSVHKSTSNPHDTVKKTTSFAPISFLLLSYYFNKATKTWVIFVHVVFHIYPKSILIKIVQLKVFYLKIYYNRNW